MFSPTQTLFRSQRRLPLTTKRARKGYYKGNRVGAMGRHTKHGRFQVLAEKVRTYVVPVIDKSFELTPFVTKQIRAPRESSLEYKKSIWANVWKYTGKDYLKEWKLYGSDEGVNRR